MKLLRLIATTLVLGGVLAAISGPNDRQPTDPKSVTSNVNPNAKPVAVEDPIKYVQNIRAPLLVLQGENDPRVPKEETEQLVNILKQRGNTVDVVYYPDEGHGFDKIEHEIDAARRIVGWFEKYLGKTAATAAGQ